MGTVNELNNDFVYYVKGCKDKPYDQPPYNGVWNEQYSRWQFYDITHLCYMNSIHHECFTNDDVMICGKEYNTLRKAYPNCKEVYVEISSKRYML